MGWLQNDAPKWIFVIIWLGINIFLFVQAFLKYHDNREYHYLRQILGYGLPFARGAAATLNFNCMLILLPVCRNLLSFVRGSCGWAPKWCRQLMDRNLEFHKLCAYMICINTAIHYWSHTFNFENFLNAHNSTRLKSTLTEMYLNDSNKRVNPIVTSDTNPMYELVTCIPGVTGAAITLSLIVIFTSATEFVRRSYFEVFWFTHHLFVVFYIGLVLHGVGGLIKAQTNVAAHNPEVCYKYIDDWGKKGGDDRGCDVTPDFQAKGPKTWMWVAAPMFLYFIERCIRFYRSRQKVTIDQAIEHPSKVIELRMKKKGFGMQAGQYVFLHCTSISRLEWHPFTLTSAPQDDFFSVHIRIVGDWTSKLSALCDKGGWNTLPLAVDGPFGTASEDVYDYDVAMLVGAGIGVTPFAAILKDMWHRYTDTTYTMKLKKVYFYWICRDTQSFEWFRDLLKDMEYRMRERDDMTHFLSYNIYLTGWNPAEAMNIAAQEEQSVYDTVTGLTTRTFYGRPNWSDVFRQVSSENRGYKIGVFFCGPSVLASKLHDQCNKNCDGLSGTTFMFNKENF